MKNSDFVIRRSTSSQKLLSAKKMPVQVTSTALNCSASMSQIDLLPINRESVSQERLDLVNRYRTSLLPWRGQFSPELIEILLTKYIGMGGVILDPFAGSGTTLFEAARKSLRCFGVEINPAAVVMASTVHFVNIRVAERKEYIRKAHFIIERHLPVHHGLDLFSSFDIRRKNSQRLEDIFQDILREASNDPLVCNIISNTIIRYTMLNDKGDARTFFGAFNQHKTIVENLPYSNKLCKVFHCDARNIPLNSGSIDMIVTSPPYINVFNYHQNYRKAMELMGWNLLRVAKSEFGSNRKNRSNRFLTVVQYAIDMLQSLCEMRRLISPEGKIIIVIGRESRVRGVSFQNSRILAALAVGGASLRFALRQERKFKNKFGKTIYEDILHFVPAGRAQQASNDFARSLAQYALNEVANNTKDSVLHSDILAASEQAPIVQASPRFEHLNARGKGGEHGLNTSS